MIKCFMLEPTEWVRRSFRRYRHNDGTKPCPAVQGSASVYSYCNANAPLDEVQQVRNPDGSPAYLTHDAVDRSDPRWPKVCPQCGLPFDDSDSWQIFCDDIYRRTDTGEMMTLRQAPPGAMWFADWMPDYWKGPDGHTLVARCPDGHDWIVDGRANNCTLPDDDVHKCWVRHGTPPNITVDKNGVTCSAGAGSILTPGYHGFLQNGYFT